MVQSLLVVEDDKDLRKLLKEIFLDKGYSVHAVFDGVSAIKETKRTHPDLVILDLGLPKMTGESVCAEIKKLFPEMPVIILTAKGTPHGMVKGLNLGADDYIAKPFEMDVLIARVKARLRDHNKEERKLQVADLILDTKTMEVLRSKKRIELAPQEFKLLEYLMQNKGRI
ncbi:response regulator transcription factor [Candidatus Roizmanbacteria bacterium]|nr:response regulator transcription factor [Candidatus Roizmanbacteria bacterium]